MNLKNFSNQTVTTCEPIVSGQTGCPMCTGMLIPMGRENLCQRCGYRVCDGCGLDFGENLEIFYPVGKK